MRLVENLIFIFIFLKHLRDAQCQLNFWREFQLISTIFRVHIYIWLQYFPVFTLHLLLQPGCCRCDMNMPFFFFFFLKFNYYNLTFLLKALKPKRLSTVEQQDLLERNWLPEFNPTVDSRPNKKWKKKKKSVFKKHGGWCWDLSYNTLPVRTRRDSYLQSINPEEGGWPAFSSCLCPLLLSSGVCSEISRLYTPEKVKKKVHRWK